MISTTTRLRAAGLLAAAAVSAAALTGCTTDPAAAALVGGSAITLAQLDHTIRLGMQNKQFAAGVGNRTAAARVELARLITQALIDQLARRLHVRVDQLQLSQEKAALSAQLASQQGVSLATYYGAVGVPADQVDSVVRSIALEQAIGAKLTPPPPASKIAATYRAQIGNYMQVHVAHILVASKALALKILAEVKAHPASFAALARKYSTDTGSAKNGGDLGTQTPSKFVAPFAKAVETAPVGSYVLVHSQFGWHVIHVISRTVESLAQATPSIEASLLGNAPQAKLQAALLSAAKTITVSVNPRFGRWDAAQLQVVASPNTVSKPAPSATP
ncbi:MAG: peptidylprolyl isomerase [Mycobacteriales bacterium]